MKISDNRLAEMVELHNKGISYTSIGKTFNISRARAHQIISGYKSPEIEIANSIKNRDGNKCQKCGTEESLLIHHIDGNDRNNDFINLMTLCARCHCKLHPKTYLPNPEPIICKCGEKILNGNHQGYTGFKLGLCRKCWEELKLKSRRERKSQKELDRKLRKAERLKARKLKVEAKAERQKIKNETRLQKKSEFPQSEENKIHIYFSPETKRMLNTYIEERFGTEHRVKSLIVDIAVRNWLKKQGMKEGEDAERLSRNAASGRTRRAATGNHRQTP